jgi:glycosyltransferase involved in cell wall biosynthesis
MDMVARPRILLVHFEGLAETVIDSTVLDYARQISRRYGVHFTIWAFCCSNLLYRNSQRRYASAQQFAGCELRIFRGVRPAIPFSARINEWLVRWHLRVVPRPDLIHARADYAAAVCAFAKHERMGLIWDCRGDVVAETAERLMLWPHVPRWFKQYLLDRVVQYRKRGAAACDAAIFVTQRLANLCRADLGNKPMAIIPTAASEDMFFFDHGLRDKARESLGFDATHRVFVYSGSLALNQGFDEVVDLFILICKSDPNARLLVLTPDTDDAKRRLAGIDRKFTIVRFAVLQNMNMYLNAADAAFMLRRVTPVNAVALPTKFAEYCLTGLPVIMTDAVPEAGAISFKLGNRARISGDTILWPPEFDRAEVAYNARTLLGKQHLAPKYDELYRGILGSYARPGAR